MSKLLSKEIINSIPKIYDTQEQDDPICQVKLFLPSTDFTWYIIELDKSNLNTCFGFVDGFEKELGYFSLAELENLKGAFGLKVERDIYFTPKKLSQIKRSVA